MKQIISLSWLAVVVLISTSVVGCKKHPERLTNIPGSTPPPISDMNSELNTGPLTGGPGVNEGAMSETGIAASNLPLDQWTPAAEQPFTADTVYFDFDKSSIRPSEVPKIEHVANMMKNYPGKALRVEGNCDERGTEEYNRALGERRALSAREYLVRLGVNYQMIDTISYGEDRPADPGHTPAAWAKNRRAEFLLLEPPK